MNLIITIILALLISYLFSLLAKKIRIPYVVALIISGLFIGFPAVKEIIIEPNTEFVFNLGNIALICLMFLAGLESSWRTFYNEKKDAAFIAVFAAFVPFLFGFILFKILGFSLLASLISGVCMSITAEATKARVLLGLSKLKTKIGSAMMAAGIIDDMLGLFLFILINYIFKEFYFKENLLIILSITAFFTGILIQKSLSRKHPKLKILEQSLLWLVIPFFFISMGIHFDLNSLILNPFLAIIVVLIAIIGKLIGTLLTKPFLKLKWKQLHLIGWGMNSRGAVELALALIAFRTNLIPTEIYSSLVVMALTTTLIFPFVIEVMIKRNPRIMN
ncbi:cation:proton antiporter [Candidatus Woesearchaeota archaeon]|nr:cation:proton antiporter [Candidatus Woesearchaeota archaeon]